VLHEIASASNVGIELDEATLPLKPEVRGAAELLGLDPLYIANEGKLVAIVPDEQGDALLATMRAHPLGRDAVCIGSIVESHPTHVLLRSLVGGQRAVPMIAGEQLPRIC
jgi:hydrogenase expression/formation protein HypE